MTTNEARSIAESFNEDNYTEEEEFRCIEAMQFLIEKERSPRDMLRTPHKVTFYYGDSLQRLESVMEDDECVINFNNRWYRTREDFFEKAEVDGVRLTSVYDELYGFKVD
ncbi:MAG: hypothetical protein IJU01_00815 [Lachnospiraceae bacterium]|nr:hypothetical protein [Lachnospiraceae bacterium]